MNSMPSTIVGEVPPMPPPSPGAPFTVSNFRAVGNSQMILPSFAANARRTPFRDPANTAPGIALALAQIPVLHESSAMLGPAPPPPPPPPRPAGSGGQFSALGSAVYHTRSPVAPRSAA